MKTGRLLTLASLELCAAAVIFLSVSLSGRAEGNWPLAAALGCGVLSGIFALIAKQQGKTKRRNSRKPR